MYLFLHYETMYSATAIVTLVSRVIFVLFYLTSLVLYSKQIIKEEEESRCEVWEPKFLSSPGGILNGGFNLAGLGTLGLGQNTNKWLENELNSNPTLITNQHHHHINPINTNLHHENTYFNDKLELPRYEVCKSSNKK